MSQRNPAPKAAERKTIIARNAPKLRVEGNRFVAAGGLIVAESEPHLIADATARAVELLDRVQKSSVACRETADRLLGTLPSDETHGAIDSHAIPDGDGHRLHVVLARLECAVDALVAETRRVEAL